jgi:hypothetical protein
MLSSSASDLLVFADELGCEALLLAKVDLGVSSVSRASEFGV